MFRTRDSVVPASVMALFASCALFGLGCDADIPLPVFEDEHSVQHEHAGDPLEVEDSEGVYKNAGGCAQRWTLPDSINTHGLSQSVPYNYASRCTGGAQSGAVVLGDHLRELFPGVINQAVLGRGVQIYNCRSVSGGGNRSIHAEGRALDIFIATQNGGADNARGDRIANWLVENAEIIGVQLIIWDRTIWRPGSGGRCYTGRHPHHDHLHVELNWEAARQNTPFFSGHTTTSPDQVTPNAGTDSRPERASWIGSPCTSDSECSFTQDGLQGHCLLALNPTSGVCTIPCQGFCPDKSTYATTFCANRRDIGIASSAGYCLSKSSNSNGHCTLEPNMTEASVNRWVGSSGARGATAEVCVPQASVTPEPESTDNTTTETPADTRQTVCAESSLELSDHGAPCSAPDNTWRCACSSGFAQTVSQVCRGGRWISYQLSPRDCVACQGSYSLGCEP